MEILRLYPILQRINGCTFASLDARTKEHGCIREVTGEQVILFSMEQGSGYENKVNRELRKLGRDETFRVGGLPWGERVENLPLITHRGFYYLQTVLLKPGESRYFIGEMEVPKPSWLRSSYPTGQDLPPDRAVLVHTYNIENITRIRLKGEEL